MNKQYTSKAIFTDWTFTIGYN